jgi:molecular chaperone DnaK (HSP70)
MRRMIFAAMMSLAFSASGQAAQIYKWVDAQGVTHFDAQPPANQQAQEVDVQKPPVAPTPEKPQSTIEGEAEQRAIDKEVKRKVGKEQAKLSEDCKVLRTNLSQLQNNPRVREQTDDGLRRLTEEERASRIEETQRAIADYCL